MRISEPVPIATSQPEPVSGDRAVMVWVRLGVISAAALGLLALAYTAFSPRLGGPAETVVKATCASMRTITTSLKGFRAETGRYPASLQELVDAKYVEKIPLDAWRRPFVYTAPGMNDRPFALLSLGPDGVAGTEDDLDWWRVDEDE